MLKTLTITLIIINVASLFSQTNSEYLWPTDASTLMSSSFCEYRDGHYHSAIDVKTWVREGYKCFAIADGKIERIRVSPFGYGKVLYLRLKDGNMAVYAHLQKFNNKIEEAVHQKQLENEKYSLNWYPKDLYVKKGDVISYTGRTGIGVPHLHFEIRNTDGHPINPLNFYDQVKDKIRPRIQKLGVIPLSEDALVNSSHSPQIFDVSYIRNGVNVIKDPIYVSGRVGLMIKGFDQADGASNKYGFHETTMNVNGLETFRITYDVLHFSTTEHIYTETYYPIWADQKEVYHKLFVEPFNPLQFYKRIPGQDGSVTIADKPAACEISVSDFHGNKSILKVELIPDLRPELNLTEMTRNDSIVYLGFSSQPFKDIQLSAGDSSKTYKKINYFEIVEGSLSRPESGLVMKTKVLDSTTRQLKIQITGKNNLISQRVFTIEPDKSIEPELSYHGKYLVYNIPPAAFNSKVIIGPSATSVQTHQLPDGRFQALLTSSMITEPESPVHIISGRDTLWSDLPLFAKWHPGETTNHSWFDSAFTITPAAGSFLETVIVRADTLAADSVSRILPTLGKIYSLSPGNIPVFRLAGVQVNYDSLPAWGNWRLFKTNGLNSLSFVGGSIDTINKCINARTNPFGQFIIACDTIPPTLEIQSPVQSKSYSRTPEIRFNLSDEHSGIGTEENISVIIDGEFVLPEWDPEDKLVTAKIDKKLTKGNHILTISIKDQSENITRAAIYFTIL